MRPTLFGVRAAIFYVAIVLAYFAAPYVNLFFLLLAFLTAVGMAGALWSLRSLGGVEAAPVASLLCAVGDQGAVATATVTAHRRRRFDVGVRLVLARAPGQRTLLRRKLVLQGAVASVPKGERRLVEVTAPDLPRGIYPILRASLVSGYPFGLLRREVGLDGPEELVVHPRPSTFGKAGSSATADEWLRELQAGDGSGDLQPAVLRDRREGDPLRAIHWRASARRGKHVVIEWEGGSGEGMEIAVDRRCSAQALEGALSDVAALVQIARDAKEVLMLRTQGHARSFGEGQAPWDEALRLLAELRPVPAGGPGLTGVGPSTPVLPRADAPREQVAAHA